MILVIAFGVIFSLVGQGLLMPFVARALGPPQMAAHEQREENERELRARHDAAEVAERHLATLVDKKDLDEAIAAHLAARNHQRTLNLPRTLSDGCETAAATAKFRLALIRAEREYLHELLRKGEITDETRRLIEHALDLEEAAIFSNREAGEAPL